MITTWYRRSLVMVFAVLLLLADGSAVSGQELVLIAGGDIEWSRTTKAPDIYAHPPTEEEGDWRRIPYLNLPDQRRYLEEEVGRTLETPESHHVRAIHYGLDFDSGEEMARHPFRLIAPTLREADIAFANLETPLSDNARWSGAFRTPAVFADGIRWAGIDVVATANNHALDAEGQGLEDTREALWKAGVGAVGTGRDLEDARRPFVIERNGLKLGFLAYAVAVNGGSAGFAQPDRSGVAPLDPFIIKEDIRALRDQVDYVVLSFHWAIENSQDTHPDAREFAYEMIDAGADIILGHHPHVPRGVEVYNGKAIFYSLGNFIFGHNHTYWMDNYLARLTLAPEGIRRIEVLPIAGSGTHLAQPYLLEGAEAQSLLEDIQTRTRALDTEMAIEGDVGVIRP